MQFFYAYQCIHSAPDAYGAVDESLMDGLLRDDRLSLKGAVQLREAARLMEGQRTWVTQKKWLTSYWNPNNARISGHLRSETDVTSQKNGGPLERCARKVRRITLLCAASHWERFRMVCFVKITKRHTRILLS